MAKREKSEFRLTPIIYAWGDKSRKRFYSVILNPILAHALFYAQTVIRQMIFASAVSNWGFSFGLSDRTPYDNKNLNGLRGR